MLHEITSEQFAEWWTEYKIEPWGELRFDLGVARVASMFCAEGTDLADLLPYVDSIAPNELKLIAAELNAKTINN